MSLKHFLWGIAIIGYWANQIEPLPDVLAPPFTFLDDILFTIYAVRQAKKPKHLAA